MAVTGAGTFSNTLAVTNSATFSNTVLIVGAATLSNTIAVTNTATFSNTMGVTGAATFANTMTVTGLGTFNGALNTTTANASVAMNVGANVNLTTSRFNVGDATTNTFITATAIETDGTLTVLGATTLSNTISVAGAATLSNTIAVTNSATFSNTMTVGGLGTFNAALNTTTANASVAMNVGANVNLSTTRINVGNSIVNTAITSTAIDTDGTLAVLGATTLSNTLSVTGTSTLANTLTIQSDHFIEVVANADIGSTTGTGLLIYNFPKATYSSGKLMVQVRNGTSVQVSEMVLAHNGTDAYVSVYGTVASPPAANNGVSPLGTYNAVINNANVELRFLQTTANSSTKVVANLIK